MKGYKPKDNKPNIDSIADCEAEVATVCAANQEVTQTGECVDVDDPDVCDSQCPDSKGRLVEGTGICQCDVIYDPTQVCNAECQANKVKTGLTKDGLLKVEVPGLTEPKEIDLSTLPGYYGDFVSTYENSTSIFMDVGEDFSFSYDTNLDILESLDVDRVVESLNNDDSGPELTEDGFNLTQLWYQRSNPHVSKHGRSLAR